ncbi:hypothetical protein D9758_006855 [Tetrapyrgos nigripes]|uniref:Glutathione hydrolase n=1 Tax=Tetrapyrgos nigripes TaxID=182062 RepID=A0A8H5CWV3_9AGAR|nr:hypothetical protein D9758_006855 [Tetrapyrgos nigripes]
MADFQEKSSSLPLPASVRPESRRPPYLKRLFWIIATICSFRLFFVNTRHFFEDTPAIRRNPAYLIRASHGAVATENVRCSNIGVDVMKEGGNAMDAAIASTLCIGVVNMFSSGIGGGGFLTVRVPPSGPGMSSEVFTIDFRETAPALSSEKMFPPGSNLSQIGGLSVAVPSELRGLEEAHRRWGSLPWKRLVQPSVDLSAGWEVDVELSRRIPLFPDLMLNNPDWSAIFAPHGAFLKEGEMIYRTNLSKTLSVIANEGPDAFYKGPIADSIVRKIQESGGIMTHADLENYQVKVYRSLKGTYLDKIIYTPDAPTSGPVIQHMLNLVEKYDFAERTGLNTHRLVEAMKFGFSARTRISDPTFRNDTAIIKQIPTKAFADVISLNITDDMTHPAEYYNPEYDVKMDHGTSHTSVLDKDGMAVAVTSTVNIVFGSQVLDPVTGIILNDEMDDFSTPGTPNAFGLWPSPYNYPEPGKRPISSTVPTILEHADGSFYMAIGGSGGSLIFPAVFQVLLNLDWGMDLSEAIERGRLHNQLYPQVTIADSNYDEDLLDALRNPKKDARARAAAGSVEPLDDEDDEEEEEEPERVSLEVAWFFPIELINLILSWYFSVAGIASVWKTSVSLFSFVVGADRYKQYERYTFSIKKGKKEAASFSSRTPSLILLPLSVIPSALYKFSQASRKSVLLTDILSLSFSHNALGLMKIDSFITGTVLLSGLFLYDIWWVFGTPAVLGTSVMVDVATQLDVPIKLLWPKSLSFSDDRGFTMLGLGDVVIPGTFVALALRYDYYRYQQRNKPAIKERFEKPYFYAALTAYSLGLATTMTVMHTFKAAQPALLYLRRVMIVVGFFEGVADGGIAVQFSPACIMSFVLTAVFRGELKDAWNWTDGPEPQTKEEEGKGVAVKNDLMEKKKI